MTLEERFKKEFGRAVKKGRKAIAMTQSELSKRLKKSQSWIAKLESGKSEVLLLDAFHISNILELDVDQIFINSKIFK